MSLATYMKKKIPQLYVENCFPVCPPVCHLTRSTNSLSHFCPKNSGCHQQKTLIHQGFVLKINQYDCQPSRLRLQ